MDSKNDHVIVLKNDAVGDLTQSLKAINNIINHNKERKVIIYLSERSKKFSFLINGKNIIFKILNYDLNIFEKLNLIIYLFKNKISDVYILTPKNFYFYLPLFFKNIKFYGLCINGPNKYKRPTEFLRKYLFKYVVNDRAAIYKRDHTSTIQDSLTKIDNQNYQLNKITLKISDLLKNNLPKNYAYFHYKKSIIDKLSWSTEDVNKLFNEILKYYDHIIFTRDIDKNQKNDSIKERFKVIDFNSRKKINEKFNSKVLLFDNIEGEELYNTILNSSKVIAFHGMMTNLASINKKKVIDMWFCEIKDYKDYRNYRNAFYEFKQNYNEYDFIIPSKDINKTIKKLKYSLKKK